MSTDIIDATLYSKNDSVSQRNVCEFLELCATILDWSNLSQDVVMDIGCGPGNSSSKLLNLFPEISKLVAVDISANMIKQAQVLNPNPKIEYCIADISDTSNFQIWEGKISKVFSSFCLNWVNDQKKAFQNIFNLLKLGGEAALMFKLTAEDYSPYDCYQDMLGYSKWSQYAKGIKHEIPECHSKKWDSSHFEKIVKEVGFDVILCKQEDKTYVFERNEDCKGFCLAVCPLTVSILEQLKEEFAEDVFHRFMKHNERDSSGRPFYTYPVLHLLLKKPDKNTSTA